MRGISESPGCHGKVRRRVPRSRIEIHLGAVCATHRCGVHGAFVNIVGPVMDTDRDRRLRMMIATRPESVSGLAQEAKELV